MQGSSMEVERYAAALGGHGHEHEHEDEQHKEELESLLGRPAPTDAAFPALNGQERVQQGQHEALPQGSSDADAPRQAQEVADALRQAPGVGEASASQAGSGAAGEQAPAEAEMAPAEPIFEKSMEQRQQQEGAAEAQRETFPAQVGQHSLPILQEQEAVGTEVEVKAQEPTSMDDISVLKTETEALAAAAGSDAAPLAADASIDVSAQPGYVPLDAERPHLEAQKGEEDSGPAELQGSQRAVALEPLLGLINDGVEHPAAESLVVSANDDLEVLKDQEPQRVLVPEEMPAERAGEADAAAIAASEEQTMPSEKAKEVDAAAIAASEEQRLRGTDEIDAAEAVAMQVDEHQVAPIPDAETERDGEGVVSLTAAHAPPIEESVDAKVEAEAEVGAATPTGPVDDTPIVPPSADPRTDKQVQNELDEAVEAKVNQLDHSESALLEPQAPYTPVETPISDIIYHFLRYCAERHKVWHRKEVLNQAKPWTDDPIIPEGRYGNVFRQLDRGSIAMQQDVISKGDQSHEEICFRIFLNNAFCNRRTWNRWEVELDEVPSLKNFDVKRYSQILDPIVARGDIIYSSEFQMVPPRHFFGATSSTMSGHTASLKMVQVMLEVDLAGRLKECKYLCDASALVQSIPGMGGFLSMNLVMDLIKSPTLKLAARDFASCGPGSREGLRRIFGPPINSTIMDNAALRWLERNQWKYWARLGEAPPHAPGLRPGLRVLDFENALCWHHRYLRVQTSKGIPIQAPPDFDAAVTDAVVAPEWPADSEENILPPPAPEEDAYEVEKVADAKGNKYRVRWVGYPPEDDTWEPEHSLMNGAQEALQDWKNWQVLIQQKMVEIAKRKTPGLRVVSKGQGVLGPNRSTAARASGGRKQVARRHSQAKAPPIASPRKGKSSTGRAVASPAKGGRSAASTPARRSVANTPRSAKTGSGSGSASKASKASTSTSASVSKKRKAAPAAAAAKRGAADETDEEEEEDEEEEWDELEESEEEEEVVVGAKKARGAAPKSRRIAAAAAAPSKSKPKLQQPVAKRAKFSTSSTSTSSGRASSRASRSTRTSSRR